MKYCLLFALLIGMYGGGQGPDAYAQQSVEPDPIKAQKHGDWVVARLDNHGGLCSVVRPFDTNGTVLTFGKMPSGEYSIAFDLRKPDFNPSTSYNVSLQAGIGQVRSFVAKPVSKQVIVMNLGKDKKFFDALKTDQSFKVNINAENYSYTLSEWGRAYNALEDCSLGKGLKPKPVQQAAKVPSNNSSHSFQASKPNKQTIQKRIALKPARKPVQLIAERFAAKQTEFKEKGSQKEAWLEPVHAKEEISKGKKETRNLLSHAEKSTASFSDGFKAKRKTVRTDITRPSVESVRIQRETHDHITSKSTTDKQTINNQVESADISRLKVLQQRVQELEGYNEELEKQLTDFRTKDKTNQNISETLEPVVEKASIQGSQDKLTQAVKRYEQSEKEVLRIGRLLREERQSCIKNQAGNKQHSSSNQNSSSQCERYREAEAETAALKERFVKSEKIAVSMKAKIANMEEQIATLQDTLKRNEKELNEEKGKLAQAKNALGQANTKIVNFQKEGDRYAESILDAQKHHGSGEKEKVIGGLEKKVSLLEKRSGKYRTRISFLERRLNEERTNYDSQIARLNSEVVALNYKVETQKKSVESGKETVGQQLAATTINAKEGLESTVAPKTLRSETSRSMAEAGNVSAIEPASRVATKTVRLAPDVLQAAEDNKGQFTARSVPDLVQENLVKQKTAPEPTKPSVTVKEISSLLNVAGVETQGVQETQAFSEKVESAYSWRSGSVEGYAEVRAMDDASVSGDFKRHIEDYVFTARSRCPGEFASVPLSRLPNLIAHDMACVSAMGDTTSSVLFYSANGRFLTISHEADVEGIDIAMDVRDRILQSLNSQTSDL